MRATIQTTIAFLFIFWPRQSLSLVFRYPAFSPPRSRRLPFFQQSTGYILKEKNGDSTGEGKEVWADQHLTHGAKEIHEESDTELLQSEEWAAFDAHDCDDPGMEAAAMESAVIMAAQMSHKQKEAAMHMNDAPPTWADQHLIHGATDIHKDTDEELLEAEEFSAVDAHDCDDPGMEAVAMERAVMMAAEMAHARKQKSKKAT